MQFSQHIVFTADDESAVRDVLDAWSQEGAGTATGYVGARLMRFRDKPGRYVLQADFESFAAAEANNSRPETQSWSDRFLALVDGEPKYENLDVLAVY